MSSVILKEIAELSNPAPKDFDPEDLVPDFEDSGSEAADEGDVGREHYVSVGYVLWSLWRADG
jgi:protein AATF/BFR2